MGMLLLILDSKTALEAARTGIDLCLRTVIPSLFPFFVLSILLTGALLGSSLPWLRPVGRLCRMPEGSESILISAFLGGYPVGAQAVAAAYHSGQLTKTDAQRMLAFCSNAGPAFLFGMVGRMFQDQGAPWLLWGIHIASALLAAALLPGGADTSVRMQHRNGPDLTEALMRALGVMAQVCGWVILFRVVIGFLQRWILWLLPTEVQVGIIGLLELSNGCCDLWKVPGADIRFLLSSAMLAFGGLCVTMQTVSVTKGLSMRFYFAGKLLQTLFSLLLSGAFVWGVWLPCCVLLAVLAAILRKMQNRGRIPGLVGV